MSEIGWMKIWESLVLLAGIYLFYFAFKQLLNIIYDFIDDQFEMRHLNFLLPEHIFVLFMFDYMTVFDFNKCWNWQYINNKIELLLCQLCLCSVVHDVHVYTTIEHYEFCENQILCFQVCTSFCYGICILNYSRIGWC